MSCFSCWMHCLQFDSSTNCVTHKICSKQCNWLTVNLIVFECTWDTGRVTKHWQSDVCHLGEWFVLCAFLTQHCARTLSKPLKPPSPFSWWVTTAISRTKNTLKETAPTRHLYGLITAPTTLILLFTPAPPSAAMSREKFEDYPVHAPKSSKSVSTKSLLIESDWHRWKGWTRIKMSLYFLVWQEISTTLMNILQPRGKKSMTGLADVGPGSMNCTSRKPNLAEKTHISFNANGIANGIGKSLK